MLDHEIIYIIWIINYRQCRETKIYEIAEIRDALERNLNLLKFVNQKYNIKIEIKNLLIL